MSAFKNLISKDLLERMGKSLLNVYPSFQSAKLIEAHPGLKSLELKPRVKYISLQLKQLLPGDFKKAVRVLLASAKDGTLSGFDLWPYSDFIQTYGLDDFELSLKSLKELTPLFSSEFAVRPFILKHQKVTMAFLEECAHSNNVDVRRWASEGSRPRLPWGERIGAFVKDPTPTFKILDTLKFDDELYVRKSVANHLNDIAKDHPELVVKILSRFKKEAGKLHEKKIDWIIRHALRSLIKSGHKGALQLIGVSQDTQILFSKFKLSQKSIRLGEAIEFSFNLKSNSKKTQKLVIDYSVHFLKSNGKNVPKVFKLKTVELGAGSELSVVKKHSIKPITTRIYYPGEQWIEIQINGVVAEKKLFKLLT